MDSDIVNANQIKSRAEAQRDKNDLKGQRICGNGDRPLIPFCFA